MMSRPPPPSSPSTLRDSNPGLRAISTILVILWVGLAGYYLWKQWSGPGAFVVSYEDFKALEKDPALQEAETLEATGIYHVSSQGRRKVGYSLDGRRRDGEGWVLHNKTFFNLQLLDQPQRLDISTTVRLDGGYRMKSFGMAMEASMVSLDMEGTVAPDGKSVVLDIRSATGTDRQTLRLDEAPYFPDSDLIHRVLLTKEKRPPIGRRFHIPVFEPQSMQQAEAVFTVAGYDTIECGERPDVNVIKVTQELLGQTALAYVDAEGRVCREEMPQLQLVMVPEGLQQAVMDGWGDGAPLDIAQSAAIPLDRPLGEATDILELILAVSGEAPLESFALNRPNQTYASGRLTMTKPEVPGTAGYVLPYSGEDWSSLLQPEPFLQADDAAIRAKMRETIGSTDDPIQAARRLHQWMWESVKKEAVVSLPNAREVLRTLRGDCNEHAILYAALGRAAGLPTRILSGLVHQNGRFYYHAWNEVWLGRWVAVDAALGQWPADATHIVLVEGGIDQQAKIMSVLGRLELSVVDLKRSAP